VVAGRGAHACLSLQTKVLVSGYFGLPHESGLLFLTIHRVRIWLRRKRNGVKACCDRAVDDIYIASTDIHFDRSSACLNPRVERHNAKYSNELSSHFSP